MWKHTALTERLGLPYPIIQAPMAGGSTTPELIAAVSNAGGLGSFGFGYNTPEQIREMIRAARRLTDKPFAANLFVNEMPSVSQEQIENVQRLLQPYRDALGIPQPATPTTFAESYPEQLAVLIEEKVPLFSFTFGMPTAEEMRELKANGILTCGTATNVQEAIALEAHGVDMISAQGSDAGGHRGTFVTDPRSSMIGTMSLIPQIVDAVKIPVIAAGGIMDGRGIAAGLMLGASAVQLGTAFLTVQESGAHAVYKEALLNSTDQSTALTRAYSGRDARGIRNRLLNEMEAHEADIPAYPIQNALTRDIRTAAAKQHDPEYLSLWAGQASALCEAIPARELMERLIAQTNDMFGRFS